MIFRLGFALPTLRTSASPPPTASNTSVRELATDVDFYNRFPRVSVSVRVTCPAVVLMVGFARTIAVPARFRFRCMVASEDN